MALRKPPPKLDARELLEYALKTLSGRAHSLSEMRQKMLRRAEHPDDIDGVLQQLKEYGYLNDRQFAETFANSRLANRGHGKMRVLRDLRERRVAPKLAEQVVTQTYQDKDEPALVDQYLQRKYRMVNLPEYLQDEKHLASAYRRLRHAGFSSGASTRVLLGYVKQKQEFLETLQDGPDEPPTEENAS